MEASFYRAGGDLLHALSSALETKCAGTDGQCTTLSSTASNKIPLKEAVDIVGEEMSKKFTGKLEFFYHRNNLIIEQYTLTIS